MQPYKRPKKNYKNHIPDEIRLKLQNTTISQAVEAKLNPKHKYESTWHKLSIYYPIEYILNAADVFKQNTHLPPSHVGHRQGFITTGS